MTQLGLEGVDGERMEQEGRKVGRFEDGTEAVIGALIDAPTVQGSTGSSHDDFDSRS